MPPVLDPSKSKVDGLAFLGLSLARKSEQGHPESYTHQRAFDLNDVLDREYDFIFSTDDNGCLVGGGEPGPPSSYKLALKDSAHVEMMRIGNYRKEWGGVPQEDIIEVMKSGEILIPQIEVLPTAVVENSNYPSELEIRFDMEPQIPDFDDPGAPLPVNWQLRFLHNQLFKRFLFPSRFCPGAFHSPILRKAEFRSEKHREQYFDKCNNAIEAWRKKGAQPLNTESRDIDGKIIHIPSTTEAEKWEETSEFSNEDQVNEEKKGKKGPGETETRSKEVNEKKDVENSKVKEGVNESEVSSEVESIEETAKQNAEEGEGKPVENKEIEQESQEEKVIDDSEPSKEVKAEEEPEPVGECEPFMEYKAEEEPESAVKSEPSTEDKAEEEPEPVVESEPEPVVESEPEPVVESEPEPVVESEPYMEGKAEEEPEPVVESEPTIEDKVAEEPEAVIESEPSVEDKEEKREVEDEPLENEDETERETKEEEKEAPETQVGDDEEGGSKVAELNATDAAPSELKSEPKADKIEDKKEEEAKTEGSREQEEQENVVKVETISADEYHSGIWLFSDRANITHFFQPNFLPPYDTPEKRKIIMDVLREEWDENTLTWEPCGRGSMTHNPPPPEEDIVKIRSGDKNIKVKLEPVTKKKRGTLMEKVDDLVEGIESQLVGMCGASVNADS